MIELEEMDIATLLNRLVQKDVEALTRFHRQYRGRLFGWARRHVAQDFDAEEVVQDALWTLYRKADTIENPDAFWGWMHRVTVNCARMLTRKKKPDPVEDDSLARLVQNRSDDRDQDRPDEVFDASQAMRRVWQTVDGFSDDNRKLFLMLEWNNGDRAEAAESMGLTDGALKVRLHRIRSSLKEAFESGG